MHPRNVPTAVFIDGAWLYATSRRINKRIDYIDLLNTLINKFGQKTDVHFFGAINPLDKQQEKFFLLLKKNGYVVHFIKLAKRREGFSSKGLDIELAMNAVQILPSIKRFVLISGDGDFVPLLKHAISHGVEVSVVALPFTTGYLLRKIVGSSFINLETLINEQKSVGKSRISKKGKDTEVLAPDSSYIKRGDHFNSYIRIRNLMKSANNDITIIDQFVDDEILTMIELLKVEVDTIIFTYKPRSIDFCLQVKKLRAEGRSITIYKTNKFHDRFLGIDNVWWHSGHSFKDLGGKDSLLTKITDKDVLDTLKTRIAEEGENPAEICAAAVLI